MDNLQILLIVGGLAVLAIIAVWYFLPVVQPTCPNGYTRNSAGQCVQTITPVNASISAAYKSDTSVTVNGANFTPNSTVAVSIQTSQTWGGGQGGIATDSKGSFTWNSGALNPSSTYTMYALAKDVTTGTIVESTPFTVAPSSVVTLHPQIQVTPTTYVAGQNTTFYFSGSGFTPSASISLYQSDRKVNSFMSDPIGYFGLISKPEDTEAFPAAISAPFHCVDDTTNTSSNIVYVTAQSGGTPDGTTSTTQPGYTLSYTYWTGSGAYGSNTNPVSWGNWAVNYGTYWGSNFYGAGYYQSKAGNVEMYFSSAGDQVTWLKNDGYNTVPPVVQPNQGVGMLPNNPYLPNSDGTLITPPSVPNPNYQNGLYWYELTGVSANVANITSGTVLQCTAAF
ncbi:MAG: hypothetical protein ABSD73_12300, partial [Candidatus Bathyarchaeia archaeon]